VDLTQRPFLIRSSDTEVRARFCQEISAKDIHFSALQYAGSQKTVSRVGHYVQLAIIRCFSSVHCKGLVSAREIR
jgi:uncharacterized protein (DUF2461 family)